ncbi:DUF2513 domain-containing protein [Legionella micdadei]|uniref:DUF2513 domain-containing protein n=1 Tax=Legionella micdadei TaxID=451 RepID=A0A098GEX1_LEGMI|nr:DUF2513 domain-containing protein [Legionella micdadei]ARG97496.1 hypothetical protein B6N58_07355 [Legionella micdadei]ARH00194.1 hypothetical protein B6V88_07065 [Legionella micdadei]KTD28393.1 hypothetical protein Lmic_1504 [Legionella micdadei]NSL17020.1 DUF2513 domain-containing protein [Legionella micdadei]CEG61014.1 conserved protein of unknown function [Legionella micdadei]
MKRNWDMIRDILLKVEALEPNALLTLDSFPLNEHNEVSYHLEILEEAGLLRGKIHKTPGGSPHNFHLIHLTWLGHDFLESIRSEAIWTEIKDRLSSKKIRLNIENIMAVAQALQANH